MTELLDIPRGMTAIIGSGGKTTLMLALAAALPGKRIICTTTKILPPEHIPVLSGDRCREAEIALFKHDAVCVGTPLPGGKLGPPACPLSEWKEICDYLIVEADGSRRLPLKAHLPHEPVIPPEADRVLLVAGLSGLGQPISRSVHRTEVFCRLCGKRPEDTVTAQDLASVILRENLSDTLILNQADTADFTHDIETIRACFPGQLFAGSIQQGTLMRL